MSLQLDENRRAVRIQLNVPTVTVPIPQTDVNLHENLRKVYQRVEANTKDVGSRFPGVVRDLSTNGAYISGHALPLLTRIHFTFALDSVGQIDVVAWTMWRRIADCEIPRADGSVTQLPMGFGVLFEAISLDARIAIHNLVTNAD